MPRFSDIDLERTVIIEQKINEFSEFLDNAPESSVIDSVDATEGD